MLRALGFDPSNDEITMLIRDLGKNITKLEEYRIDFQEFLDIMIAKMVAPCNELEKDSDSDIDKAFDLFKDPNPSLEGIANPSPDGYITKKSLMAVAKELGKWRHHPR